MSMGFGWLGRNEIIANRIIDNNVVCCSSSSKQKRDNRPILTKLTENYNKKEGENEIE